MSFHEWLSWMFDTYTKIKHAEISTTLWALWFARNRLVLEGTNQDVGELVVFVRSYCAQLTVLAGGVLQASSNATARWYPPPRDFVKVNVDAGFQLGQKKASSGVVTRYENGQILGACSRTTYLVLFVFAADAIAVTHGLRFAYELRFLSVILEEDSKLVIEKICSDKEDLSEISVFIWEAKEFSKFFHSCCFQFVGRFANSTAHAMAKDGLSCDEDRFWVEEASTVVVAAAAEDRRPLDPP
ncbi:hypothetical protein J1N35_025843 [Gossypium stocksii]|uniref:RNase H type-1 domain-containing protein n=1 Tax=Gossypium stocksii TaxID=47602 RepID=A0A9D3ZWK7_9ROSI|nr:hypothetical protein J1N35_025843 [Gossypium stocksii]